MLYISFIEEYIRVYAREQKMPLKPRENIEIIKYC